MENVEITLQGKQVVIFPFAAMQGWKLTRRLMSVLGPVMGEAGLGEGGIAGAIGILFDRLTEEEMEKLLLELTSQVTIDGHKCNFNRDLGVNKFTVDLIEEVIKANFEEFFTMVQDKVGDFLDTNLAIAEKAEESQ